MNKANKDFLPLDKGIRIDKKKSGEFLDSSSKVVKFDDPDDEKCPIHGLNGKYIPPSEIDGTVLYITYECPEGHKFIKTVSTLDS